MIEEMLMIEGLTEERDELRKKIEVVIQLVAEIAIEREALEHQVTELQTRMTKMVESQLSRRVRAFRLKYGHPVNWTPTVPATEAVRFQLKLIAEEFFELLAACEIWPRIELGESGHEVSAAELVENAIDADFAGHVDLSAFVDAIADLSYVNEGAAALVGVNMDPIYDEVQRANMAKEPVLVEGKLAPYSKPTKPSDWKPPDVEGELRKQGWKP